MSENLKPILEIEKKDKFEEQDLSNKIKEFLEHEKTEYPTFALTSMIMDSFASGATVFKVTKEIKFDSPLQEKFEVY